MVTVMHVDFDDGAPRPCAKGAAGDGDEEERNADGLKQSIGASDRPRR